MNRADISCTGLEQSPTLPAGQRLVEQPYVYPDAGQCSRDAFDASGEEGTR
ncbi:hypothetical protein [Streptomyces sp. NPDC018957]|uniref:hypothetical protein n=1 Tax=Streptomyces sp. NPDC018957 TaxID=3365056 RepID=UPI0037B77F80